jgi:Protein of unknown function (DUF4230)
MQLQLQLEMPAEPRRALVWGLVVVAVVVAAALGVLLVRTASSTIGSFGRPNAPTISHDVVVERLREVAKLVATEMTLKDVVIYEQTRFRSTKRVLLVVTGRVSAGINLSTAKVEIDSSSKQVTITIPPAQITSVDVTNVTTYDESAGILNPFTTDDRDEIQRRIRVQLRESAQRSGILEHADQAAAKALRDFLALGGYTVEVRRPLALERPRG